MIRELTIDDFEKVEPMMAARPRRGMLPRPGAGWAPGDQYRTIASSRPDAPRTTSSLDMQGMQ